MMRAWKTRTMLLLAVALPVCLVLFMGPVQAQYRPPRPITQPKTFNPPTIKPPNFNPPRNLNPPGINQPNIPFNPPVFNPPNNLQTWVCSRCGANLGNGAAPVGQCPSCKARIINGAGGGNPGFNAPNFPNPPPADFVRLNQAPPPAAVTNSSGSSTVGYIMGAIAGLGMMIGGVITSLKCGGIF